MPSLPNNSLLNLLDFLGFVRSEIVEEDFENSPSKSILSSENVNPEASIKAFLRLGKDSFRSKIPKVIGSVDASSLTSYQS